MHSIAMSTSVASSNHLSIDGEANDTTSNATHLFEDENFWESDSSGDSEDYTWSHLKGSQSSFLVLMILVGMRALAGALLAGLAGRRHLHHLAPFVILIITPTVLLLVMKDNFTPTNNVYE